MDGVADGVVYGDAADLVVSWQAADATSGVGTVAATLDGAEITSGTYLPLYRLPLGFHRLSVAATDLAGNRTEQTLEFATHTSTREISLLLQRFRATSRLSLPAYTRLTEQLAVVRLAEADGDDERALAECLVFQTLAADAVLVPDADVRSVLVRDAGVVAGRIEGR
ncbi:hypothetical protein [Amycolatopsis suaedae]|uniref:Uncharacterized protein n=1 Tax=Amycolatopsis suaedae TaxID=2510978 RepID=A0A4Q7J475_9PSEU|nr:hypothetical protein [Amycolatopsis suaedae]RZQ61819.1 hypothetical protein EWH70_23015 [Amycolatopsis suaedae]